MVTGPRQSGKTTLLKSLYGETYRFVTLEDPDIRMRALDDPRSFLAAHAPPVIIDEIQYAPELLSYIKTAVDEKRTGGQWLLTGSQNFSLMQGISQSLAGRAAVLSLLPFSYNEQMNHGEDGLSVSNLVEYLSSKPSFKRSAVAVGELVLRGSYPEIASRPAVNRQLWCGSYIATYLERDVRNITSVGDLNQFERFLRLCAARTAQLLNLSEMARDIGISVPTAKRWLSILEASYQVYLLYPYYKNIGKRLVKSPKLYFTDTGLASYLMGVHEEETLMKGPFFGSLFETMIVTDFWKRFLHHGQLPSLYFIRTRDGLEVDLVIELGADLHLFEIKTSATITSHHANALTRLKRELPSVKTSALISQGDNAVIKDGVLNFRWNHALSA